MAGIIESSITTEIRLPKDPTAGVYFVIPVVHHSRSPPSKISLGPVKRGTVQPIQLRVIDKTVLVGSTVQISILESRPQCKPEDRTPPLAQLQVRIILIKSCPVITYPLLLVLIIHGPIAQPEEIDGIVRGPGHRKD